MASLSKVTGIAWFRSLPKPLRKHVLFSTAITILAIALSMYCARSYSIPNINYDIPLQGNASIKVCPWPSSSHWFWGSRHIAQIGMVTQYIDINVNDGRVVVDWFPLSFDDTLPGTLVDIYVDPWVIPMVYINQFQPCTATGTPCGQRTPSQQLLPTRLLCRYLNLIRLYQSIALSKAAQCRLERSRL